MTDRIDDIVALADFVAESYFPYDAINPYSLCDNNGVTYNFGRYEDAFDGLLEFDSGEFHVYGNLDRIRDHAYPRARFTFAHELGHFYIDDHRRALQSGVASVACVTEFQSDARIEREADLFASHLLMPNERFRSNARTFEPGSGAIKKLAAQFGTSYSSSAIRYAQADVTPVIAMCWTKESRRWCWSSKDLSGLTNNWAFKHPSRLPVDAETIRVLANPSATPRLRGTTLSAWFPRIAVGSNSDLVMIEDVLTIGVYGVITLLYPAN